MPNIQGGPGRGRYLVSCSDSQQLQRFISESAHNHALKLLDTIGPEQAPHTAVYDMAHDDAADLDRRFATSGALKIERDQPMSLFGDS